MTGLSRLLLIPCLAPLMTVLLLSAAHRTPKLQLKILTWTTPPLPLGAWTALAATAGTTLSGLAAILMLPSQSRLQATRSGREVFEFDPPRQQAKRSAPSAIPERDIRDPAPTVSVPYRVIQRPSRAAETPVEAPVEAPVAAAAATPMDDWGLDPDQDW